MSIALPAHDRSIKAPETAALNWSYGCGLPDDWGNDLEEQLAKQIQLWNRLVEIDLAHRTEYRALTSAEPAVAALEKQISTLESALADATDARNRARQSARCKAGGNITQHDDTIKTLVAQLKPVRDQVKIAHKGARERLAPALKILEEKRWGAVTEARQRAAADGLWWGNYNAVMASFEAARQRALKTDTDLHLRRFDGAGRFTVQVQGGMTADELFSGARSEVRVERTRVAPNGEPSRWSTLVITAYAQRRRLRRTVSIPIMMHRPFPEGAAIKGASLIRRQLVPGRFHYNAVFQVVFPKTDAVPSGLGVAGVDLGWRQLSSGLRLAVLADDSGHVEHVTMPGDIVRRFELVKEMQSDIGLDLGETWRRVVDAEWSAAPQEMADALKVMRTARTPHPRHMAELLKAWPEAWEQEGRNILSNFLHRDRVERLRLARTHRRIVVDGVVFRSGLRVEALDGKGSRLSTPARHNSRIAAAGELRAWIVDAGKRAGDHVRQGGGNWEMVRSVVDQAACAGDRTVMAGSAAVATPVMVSSVR